MTLLWSELIGQNYFPHASYFLGEKAGGSKMSK